MLSFSTRCLAPTRMFAASIPLLANKGKVISWIASRGFGFIEDDADKKQHFVHFSALKVVQGGFKALNAGQEVEFDVVQQDGRTRADNVTKVGGGLLESGPRPPDRMDGPPRRGGGFRGRGGNGGGFRGGRGGYNNGGNNGGNNNGGGDDF